MIDMKAVRDSLIKSRRGFVARSDFENVKVNDIHYSRFIASWNNVCQQMGQPTYYDEEFTSWLESMGISGDDIVYICELARCGKMELEIEAKKFLKSQGS